MTELIPLGDALTRINLSPLMRDELQSFLTPWNGYPQVLPYSYAALRGFGPVVTAATVFTSCDGKKYSAPSSARRDQEYVLVNRPRPGVLAPLFIFELYNTDRVKLQHWRAVVFIDCEEGVWFWGSAQNTNNIVLRLGLRHIQTMEFKNEE